MLSVATSPGTGPTAAPGQGQSAMSGSSISASTTSPTVAPAPAPIMPSTASTPGGSRRSRPSFANGALSLTGSMPTSSPPSSTTPFNHPASFPWAQQPFATASNQVDGHTASLATSITASTSEAPDYFAQHIVQSPAATSTFESSSVPSPQPSIQPQQQPAPVVNITDSSNQALHSTGSASEPFIPSGALYASGPGSRFSLPFQSSKMAFALGGVPMSAHSSRRSTASSVQSVAASTHSAVSSASASTGMAEDLLRFKPVEPDALASLLVQASDDSNNTASETTESSDGKSSDATTQSSGRTPEKVLLIDIRSSASYASARIKSSINVCAPSTLLKRPGITVDQVEDEMLGSEGDRRRFKRWREGPRRIRQKASDLVHYGPAALHRSHRPKKSSSTQTASPQAVLSRPETPQPSASSAAALEADVAGSSSTDTSTSEDLTLIPGSADGITKIIVLDTDTARVADAGKATTGGGASCLVGMLRKFEAAGFAGELGWLVGGFNRFAGSQGAKEAGLIDRAPLAAPATEDDKSQQSAQAGKSSGGKRHFLAQPRGLPLSAFNTSTTTSHTDTHNASESANVPGTRRMDTSFACANPFFDNIRQNRELAHGITERVPLHLPNMSAEQESRLPGFLKQLVRKTEPERAEELAQGFFAIEKAEQRRLMGTMQQHAAESGADPRRSAMTGLDGKLVGGDGNSPSSTGSVPKPSQLSSTMASINGSSPTHLTPASETSNEQQPSSPFPFSIAAALERGADNRYDNIWTYEHSRVRLGQYRTSNDPKSGYINASYLQPAREFGCERTYIATQAPLPTTFEHFWTMCWEQNVRVIVMVTREHEAGRIQAHRYWDATCYGRDIRLRKVREQCFDSSGAEVTDGHDEANRLASNANDEAGGFFGGAAAAFAGKDAQSNGGRQQPVLIRRTFALSNAAQPQEAERTITQIQYVAWPDYTVPESPQSLLRLLDVADAAQFEAEQDLKAAAKAASDATGGYFAHALGGNVSQAASSQRPVGPMVVHCSAGVGRTGTFVAVDSALDAIRRQRAQVHGNLPKGVWHNGRAATSANGKTANVKMADVSPTLVRLTETHDPITPPRPALKREHSMDVDEKLPSDYFKGANGVFGGMGSNGPLRLEDLGYRPRSRTRSIEPGGSDGENEPALFPSAPVTGTSSPELQPGWSAPSPLPTPLRHLDSMRLTAAPSTSTIVPSSVTVPSANQGADFSPMATESTPQAHSPVQAVPAVQDKTQAVAANAIHAPAQAPALETDVIRRIVEVMREQRMSSVQTTRQYVFVYSAVLEGVLRDLRDEGVY